MPRMRATGGNLIAVNATGCLEVFTTPYPETSWQIPWVHSLFGNAAAVATGVAAAMRVKGRPEVRTIAQGGDGGTTDIGFGCLSGMFERNDDVLYICYDNEGLHEHRRAALLGDAAGRAHRHHAGLGEEPGNRVRHRQERAEDRRSRTASPTSRPRRSPTCTTSSARSSRRWASTARATSISTCRARSAGARPRTTPSGWRGSRSSPGCSRCSRPSTAASPASRKIRQRVPVDRLSEAAAPLRPSVQHGRGRGAHRAAAGDGGRATSPTIACSMHGEETPDGTPLRASASTSARASPTTPARGAPRARSMSTGCRPATTPARPARISRAGCFTPSPATTRTAWRTLTQDNPLPAVMGRVCYHPCESACNRAQIDEAVGINSVERFLGDQAIKHGWRFAPPPAESGKRVLVVGAGPSGLSAAYHLRRMGHAVEIHEAGPFAGGMMRFGIPKYRLPRDVLDAEIKRIVDLGVTLKLEHQGRQASSRPCGRADSTPRSSRSAPISASAPTFRPARPRRCSMRSTLLRSMEGEEKPLLGRRVVVYGGGNTAIDAARTAKRLGATEAIIVYRRTRDRMPAHDFEVEEALQEGIMMKWLSTIKRMDEGELTVEKMKLDDKGFPQPTGEFETLAADSLVLALGQDVDLSLLDGVPGLEIKDGVVQVAANMMTGHAGIFAGGDMVPSERTVTVAVGHGKKAARHIDAWLRGEVYAPPPKHELASFDKLNAWYYADAPKTVRPTLEIARRKVDVRGGAGRASTRPTRSTRRAAACPAATASSATTATASARTTP